VRSTHLVVLGVVNRVGLAVLRLVEASLVLLGEMSAVPSHHFLLMTLDVALVSLQPVRLLRSQAAIVNSILDSPALIRFPRVYFVNSRMTRVNYSRTSSHLVGIIRIGNGTLSECRTRHQQPGDCHC